jgi:hypothetical protein
LDNLARNKARFSRNTFYYGIAFVSLIVLISNIPTAYQRLTCAFQVQQEEAVNLEFGRVLLEKGTLYRDIRQEGPYLHPYPFLYPYYLSVCMRLIPGLWLPGRLPAFLAFGACGLCLAFWGWKRWGPSITLALLGLFFLSPTWFSWSTMARMDSLLVLIDLVAFLTLYRKYPDDGENKQGPALGSWLLAGLLNSLGLMMKYSACIFTLTALTFALKNRKWKQAGVFLLAVLIPTALTTAYWQWVSHGAYGLLLKWQAGDLHLTILWSMLSTSFMRECGWLVLALLPFLIIGSIPLMLRLQVIFSVLWFLLAACEATSAENHYMEFLVFGLCLRFIRFGRGVG